MGITQMSGTLHPTFKTTHLLSSTKVYSTLTKQQLLSSTMGQEEEEVLCNLTTISNSTSSKEQYHRWPHPQCIIGIRNSSLLQLQMLSVVASK